MSDEAAAPVEPVEAPAEGAEKPAPKEAAPVEVDELEELLKKKPLKYKAGGKEKALTSSKDLARMLSRVSGVDAAASEALQAKEEAQALKAKKEGIKKLKGAARAHAIAEFFEEDPTALREAFAEDILADEDRRQAREKMSERERQLSDENERYKSEHQKYAEQQERFEKQQEEEQMMQRVQEVGARLEKVAVGALQKAKIPGSAAPYFLPAIARRLDRNERLGLELDEDEVAGAVMEEHGQLADTFYGSLDIPALADRLEAMMVDDPDKPGEKVSRAKLLRREYARRIKEKQPGSAPVVTNGAPKQAQPLVSDADKLNFWRQR